MQYTPPPPAVESADPPPSPPLLSHAPHMQCYRPAHTSPRPVFSGAGPRGGKLIERAGHDCKTLSYSESGKSLFHSICVSFYLLCIPWAWRGRWSLLVTPLSCRRGLTRVGSGQIVLRRPWTAGTASTHDHNTASQYSFNLLPSDAAT